jgi:tetratricopeptide (TPR) repeat protein
VQSPRIFRANRKSKEHWLDVDIAYQKAKQHAKAIAVFDHVVRLESNREALAACEQALRLNSDDAVVYSTYGDVLFELGHYEEALANYKQALRLDPTSRMPTTTKGLSFINSRVTLRRLNSLMKPFNVILTMHISGKAKETRLNA